MTDHWLVLQHCICGWNRQIRRRWQIQTINSLTTKHCFPVGSGTLSSIKN